ncbi:MAG: methyltransferase domain-containing protein [Gomphosphaeria aponina SAG 52.96 = DSM 107014]|uniref:Methyltransferase domain-containing protein n=1 Tax=Gomphosphaeria aponina SAG 52.96 = DSM 107014 TaxID=1521640 RepID=A0A941JUZ3_9CHRO|nr:methyltransferase domain-containing protein [Gomphosphaeria aponina SAG 52.96 = DSM 107014]
MSNHLAVAQLYNTYPFPPDPLLDEPPPGYNWRWNWLTAYNFCTGQKPPREDIRILDAGCGTGVSTEYLIYLNPQAEIVAIDVSEKALSMAEERCRRSGVKENHKKKVEFHQLKLEEAAKLPGEFDLINSVGVLHHLPNPEEGIKSLANKLRPGGLMHIFVYAELGRFEISLMQQAIALLQGERRGDYQDGVKVGRQLFASLPENNRLVQQEKKRWSLENHHDTCFADMYVHPLEHDYNIETLFKLIDASGLEFIGFSNPGYWDLERLVGKAPDLIERAKNLSDREIFRLIELLDPEITHYEFFLGRLPLIKADWSKDETLLAAIPERNPCIHGWPSQNIFNHDFQVIILSEVKFLFLSACDGQKNVGDILTEVTLDLAGVRSLLQQQLILLAPA